MLCRERADKKKNQKDPSRDEKYNISVKKYNE